MLKLTRDKFRDCPSVEVAPITSIKPLEFDLLVCSSVIEYVDHPAEFLRMLADYVRPHGVLLITFANKHAPLQIISRHFLKHMKKSSYANIQQNAFSKSLIRRLSDQSQLEIVSLATPVGLPVFARLGLGELHFLVARKKA
jgi:2-polyprenyl-3-methyl-5-hydroxy-6-metoxy-1,4-benzoquinol methylase